MIRSFLTSLILFRSYNHKVFEPQELPDPLTVAASIYVLFNPALKR